MSASPCELAGSETAAAWRALAARWDLTEAERSELRRPEAGMEAPPPVHASTRVRILLEIGYRLGFDDEGELREWLRRPGPVLGSDAPLDVMAGPMAGLLRLRGLVERGYGS